MVVNIPGVDGVDCNYFRAILPGQDIHGLMDMSDRHLREMPACHVACLAKEKP